MGKRLIERRLRADQRAPAQFRDELAVIDDQLAHLADDADDMGIRALVAETPGAGHDYARRRPTPTRWPRIGSTWSPPSPNWNSGRTSCSTR